MNYKEILPDKSISDFVKRFWLFENQTAEKKHYTILPDGYFDLTISIKNNQVENILLCGIWTNQIEITVPSTTKVFGITFKPFASEYIFQQSIADILNKSQSLDTSFWGIDKFQFENFESVVSILSKNIVPKNNLDNRKNELFKLLFSSLGTLSVKELSEKVFWSSRQINRYFKKQFGLSLKAYCNILRCKSSYKQLSKGFSNTNENFTDQSHFIKEIKKHTGTTPKKLAINKNDRFIQFSTQNGL